MQGSELWLCPDLGPPDTEIWGRAGCVLLTGLSFPASAPPSPAPPVPSSIKVFCADAAMERNVGAASELSAAAVAIKPLLSDCAASEVKRGVRVVGHLFKSFLVSWAV